MAAPKRFRVASSQAVFFFRQKLFRDYLQSCNFVSTEVSLLFLRCCRPRRFSFCFFKYGRTVSFSLLILRSLLLPFVFVFLLISCFLIFLVDFFSCAFVASTTHFFCFLLLYLRFLNLLFLVCVLFLPGFSLVLLNHYLYRLYRLHLQYLIFVDILLIMLLFLRRRLSSRTAA